MTDYSTAAQEVADAMNAVYENKQTNKKDDISGDFSTDAVSYPTVRAVKTQLALKVSTSDIVNNLTSSTVTNKPLSAKQGYELKQYIDQQVGSATTAGAVTVTKQSTADTGYAATYVVKQNNAQVGVKINIPKDFLVKSASLETCSTANSPVNGYKVGDKYLDFVINAKDNSATAEHLYILVSDLIDTYTADDSTLQLSSSNVFSIKNNGVNTTQIKDGAVTAGKIATAVKNTWLTTTDVENEISAFASALANAINPS